MLILSVLLLTAQHGEDIRREQVMQWAVKADAASCQSLEAALTDASSDIRQRAATALYGKCDRSVAGSRATAQLCRSADLGTASAAVYLLLGYASSRSEAEVCLQKKHPGWEMVKLATASRPVPAALAVRVAMARLGDEKALVDLRMAFTKNSVDEALFLLAALPDVEDKQALESSLHLLDDLRECAGVKSGSKRKVRDVAADALIQRFRIAPGYPLPGLGKRYAAGEIAGVREGARVAVGARK